MTPDYQPFEFTAEDIAQARASREREDAARKAAQIERERIAEEVRKDPLAKRPRQAWEAYGGHPRKGTKINPESNWTGRHDESKPWDAAMVRMRRRLKRA